MGKHSKEPVKKENKKNKIENLNNKEKKSKKYNRAPKRPRRLMKTVLTMLVIGTVLSGFLLYRKVQQLGGGMTGILATLLGESQETLENLEPLNIVVMGISGVDDYKLADTIMIVSYNPKSQKAALISIPRDTYVGKQDRKTASKNYLESYKINTVFRNQTNIPGALERIGALTGMKLENYIIIDTKALVKLVDAIGGVTFDVPINMNYDDDSQDLHINLTAGEQHIDGTKAEQLLRFRHNNDGTTYPNDYGQQDLGRMRTQREFVTATIKQTMKPQNIFKLRKILEVMNEEVNTNLELELLKKYIPLAVNFDVENLKTDVLEGSPEYNNGVSIFVANQKSTATKITELFGEEGTNSIKNEKK